MQLPGAIMESACDAGRLHRSLVHRIPTPTVERDEMRFLTHHEVARLADAIDPACRALVLVLSYAGLRIGEAAAMRPEHRIQTRRELDVTQTVAWVKGTRTSDRPRPGRSWRTGSGPP